VTGETERLFLVTEDRMGIKADEGDLEKFRSYLIKTYGREYEEPSVLEKVFDSGEAANFLTVNETYFFREPAHFGLLRSLLPGFHGRLRICSAATSSGCEAYSIAAVLERYNTGASLPYRIDAFDINPQVIAAALRGVYGRHSLREDGSCYRHLLAPYLQEEENGYTLAGSLRRHINFFVHNIMDPLPGESYDLVFFRNAFIYFSPRNRNRILSNLASSMKEGARLFMGVSETAGVSHPLLGEENRDNVFYFRKNSDPPAAAASSAAAASPAAAVLPAAALPPEKEPDSGAFPLRGAGTDGDLHVDPARVETIVADEKAAADLACRVRERIRGDGPCDGNELTASALFLLNRGDFSGVDPLLRFIEERDGSAFTAFLRGEYYYLQDMFTEAEFHYKISLGKNSGFWPAQYRLSSLAEAGVLRDYRARQARESLSRSRDLRYEVFIGGFSPDYYLGALLKRHS
jgi:chemotaxis protein methyltransferase CheR